MSVFTYQVGNTRMTRAWLYLVAVVVAVVLVIAGIVGLVRWNVLVTCDHWEEVLDRPTRLDTWGPGCVVQLDDGTELPVHQVHEFQERQPR